LIAAPFAYAAALDATVEAILSDQSPTTPVAMEVVQDVKLARRGENTRGATETVKRLVEVFRVTESQWLLRPRMSYFSVMHVFTRAERPIGRD
jgi:hypothetical protein